MRSIVTAATLVLCLASPNAVRAQSAISAEVGFITAFEEAVFQVGVRWTTVKQGGVGVDFALGTLPEGIAAGVFVVLPNLDMTAAVPVGPRAWLLPRIGVSALVGTGEDLGALPGFNLGVGLLGRIGEKMGARMDVTHQRYLSGGESLGLTTLTFGIAWMQ